MSASTVSGSSANSGRSQRGDRIFGGLVLACANFVIFLLIAVILVLVIRSQETINRFGIDFFTQIIWDPVKRLAGETITRNGQEVTLTEDLPGQFGAAGYIYGTVVTSILALLIATPFAIGSAIFVSEYCPRRIGDLIAFTIELLVAIPSVAYGVFGFLILGPILRDNVDPFLRSVIGPIPVIGGLFRGRISGLDIFSASIILAIMILPTILAVSREVIRQVPRLQKDGMLALGATKWEAIRIAIIPYARTGIVGGALLGLARGIGETMAVTMTIGNGDLKNISGSLFQSTRTLASAIASQYEAIADNPTFGSAIVQLGLVLLIVSSAINLFSRFLVSRVGAAPRG